MPQEGPAGSEGSPAESEESPAESAEVDPITAALQSGHFDEETFLRSTSGEQGTQGDGDAAPEGEDPAGEDPAGEDPAGEAPVGEAPVGEAPVGEAPVGEDLPEGEEEP